MGTLTFAGTVSLAAAADAAGFLDSHVGAWPAVVNERGAEVVCQASSEVAMEWLLWNQGGEMLVGGRTCHLVQEKFIVIVRVLRVLRVPGATVGRWATSL